MPVSPLTPLSLTVEVNLHKLRAAFKELEENYGFYTDSGDWCCRTCAGAFAWQEGAGKPFVFWDEQNEDNAHDIQNERMALYYGIAQANTADIDTSEVANTIIRVLLESNLVCDWDGDIGSCLYVHLNGSKPINTKDDEFENDYMDVTLFVPMNETTEEYCWNESVEEDGEPAGTYYFCQKIEDGESLKDALLKVSPGVRDYIMYYQRNFNDSESMVSFAIEPVSEIDSLSGHAGWCSLKDALEAQEDQ